MDFKDMKPEDVMERDVLLDSVADVAEVHRISTTGNVELRILGNNELQPWRWLATPVRLLARDGRAFEPLPEKDVDAAIESIRQTAARQTSLPG